MANSKSSISHILTSNLANYLILKNSNRNSLKTEGRHETFLTIPTFSYKQAALFISTITGTVLPMPSTKQNLKYIKFDDKSLCTYVKISFTKSQQ